MSETAMQAEFDAVVAILVTPFGVDGQIDRESLYRLVNHYIENQVTAIVVPAVASEVDKLGADEREWIVRQTIAAAEGRTPVVGGVLGENGSQAARLAESAMQAGCSSIMCRAPEAICSDPQQAYEYFCTVASAGMQRLVIQDLSFKSTGLGVDLILKLYEKLPAFRDIKVEVDRTNIKATELHQATGRGLHVWSGWALLQMMEALDRGIRTFCPSAFHRPFVEICRAYFDGDRDRAGEMFDTILPYLAWSRQNSDINLQLLKKYCLRQGLFSTDKMREPVLPYDPFHQVFGDELIERMLVWNKSIRYEV